MTLIMTTAREGDPLSIGVSFGVGLMQFKINPEQDR